MNLVTTDYVLHTTRSRAAGAERSAEQRALVREARAARAARARAGRRLGQRKAGVRGLLRLRLAR